MITENPIFGLTVQNLPIVNIRQEFGTYLAALSDDTFVCGLNVVTNPVTLPLFTWRGLPKGALTIMLQRSILGVESCVSAAVVDRLTVKKRLTAEMAAAVNDVGSLPGRRKGMADAFYNKLPALVDSDLRLEIAEPELWPVVQRFYKEVRNPLFHGYQLATINSSGALKALQMLGEVYNWIDGWWGVP